MAATKSPSAQSLVLVTGSDGVSLIPSATPLTRLNYFDGKYLRAQDLEAEQRYLRRLVELGNQAGGSGVVHGFDLRLAGGDQLQVSAGLALDPEGRVLLLPQGQPLSVTALIDASRGLAAAGAATASGSAAGFGPCAHSAGTTTSAVPAQSWYLITVAQAEALCGEEDVYGALCEQACVTTTDRPYRVEGVVLRAHPLTLSSPLPASQAVGLTGIHLRSRLASAYFADEAAGLGDPMSAAALASAVWCSGAVARGGREVPLGVLVREGGTTLFVDQWTARRERMDAPAKRYWQWRMAMRPWDVYLAQILQFQCQLRDALDSGSGTGRADDPCNQAKSLVAEAADYMEQVTALYRETAAGLANMAADVRSRLLAAKPGLAVGLKEIGRFQERLKAAGAVFTRLPQDRMLIARGLVELPSAGYLPVVPGDTLSVNDQVRRLLGEGLDLNFCIVRPDFVPHALEEAQHMERISLLEGLDHPDRKPEVDILVPNGRIAPGRDQTGRYYEMRLNLIPDNLHALAVSVALGERLEQSGVRQAELMEKAGAREETLALAGRVAISALVRQGETYRYEGVGRGEAVPGRGISFHFAGLSDPFELEPVKPVAAEQPALSVANGTDASVLSLLRDSAPEARPATGEEAAQPRAEVFTNQGALDAANRINKDPQSYWVGGTEKSTGLRSSLWASMGLADDPTGLARGAQTRATAEVYLLVVRPEKAAAEVKRVESVVGSSQFLIRATFNGDFRVDTIGVRGARSDTVQVDGELSGEVSITLQVGTGNTAGRESEVASLHLSEPVSLVRTPGAFGAEYRIELREPQAAGPLVARLLAEREWTAAEAAQVRGAVTFRVPKGDGTAKQTEPEPMQLLRAFAVNSAAMTGVADSIAAGAARVQERSLFRAWQSINPAVADPAHPAHERAIRAVRAIGTALGPTRFADVKAAQLFPAPPMESAGLTLLGTLDWVLFHRRRTKTCQPEAPRPQVQTRTYALYQVTLESERDIDRVQKALAANDAAVLQRLKPDFLQVVEFAAGVQTVLTSQPQVRATWRQDVGAQAGPIVGGVIASSGAAVAEGKALAQERLEALADLISPESGLVQAPDWMVLERIPDGFGAARVDGVVLYLTVPQKLETTCHRVYWLTPVPDKQLEALLSQGALDQLPGIDGGVGPVTHEVAPVVRLLGTLGFQGNDTAPLAGTDLDLVRTGWEALNLGCAPGAVLCYRSAAAGTAGDALIGQRGQAIAGLLGGQSVQPKVLPAGIIPGDCPVVTLVAPAAACLQVFALKGNRDLIKRLIDQGDVPGLIGDQGTTVLGQLTLCALSRKVFGGQVNTLGPNDKPQGLWFAVKPGFTGLTEDQAAALVKEDVIPRLGPLADGVPVDRLVLPAGVAWPTECPVLAFAWIRQG